MLKALRLLLVEDTPISAEVAGEILRGAGYAFDLAVDGLEAVEAVRRVPYALVLMDCQLPRLDGYEATRRIREIEASHGLPSPLAGAPRPARLPIVAVTAGDAPEDHERARVAGMDGYLVKPVSADRLLSAIEMHTAPESGAVR
jgi:CheY-like chemotaxis protein